MVHVAHLLKFFIFSFLKVGINVLYGWNFKGSDNIVWWGKGDDSRTFTKLTWQNLKAVNVFVCADGCWQVVRQAYKGFCYNLIMYPTEVHWNLTSRYLRGGKAVYVLNSVKLRVGKPCKEGSIMKLTKSHDVIKLIPRHSTLKWTLTDARHPANIDLVKATGHPGGSSDNLGEAPKNLSVAMGQDQKWNTLVGARDIW